MMRVTVGGQTFERFSMVRVAAQLNALSRAFEIRAEASGIADMPWRKGQRVKIAIEDASGEKPIFDGWIQRITVTQRPRESYWTISGNDRLIDLADSTLDQFGFMGFRTVSGFARKVLDELSVRSRVIDLAGTDARPFPEGEPIMPEPEQSAYEFLSRLARRRTALLTSDGDANLVITQGIGLRVNGRLVNRLDGKGNNLEEIEYVTDDSERWGTYTTIHQPIPAAGLGPAADDLAGVAVAFADAEIRASRRRSISHEAAFDFEGARQRAEWEASLARAQGDSYDVTLGTWYDADGLAWDVNTAPYVEDEYAGIDTRMLVKGATWIWDEREQTSELSLTDPNAFQAELKVQAGQELALGIDDEDS